jgi:hypothetical protein
MIRIVFAAAVMAVSVATAFAQEISKEKTENFESWPVLKSTFPSTGGGGVMIKGYDPVIADGKCVTTFMATDNGKVYFNIVEFETVAVQGGTLCTNGKWRAFDNSMSGTTPYRVFFKDGVFRGQP